MYVYVCIYVYIYTHVSRSLSLSLYIYIYIYIYAHTVLRTSGEAFVQELDQKAEAKAGRQKEPHIYV